jgi:hypothetical protein
MPIEINDNEINVTAKSIIVRENLAVNDTITPAGAASEVESGTRMLFQSFTSPVGWTRVTSDAAMDNAIAVGRSSSGSLVASGSQTIYSHYHSGTHSHSQDHRHDFDVNPVSGTYTSGLYHQHTEDNTPWQAANPTGGATGIHWYVNNDNGSNGTDTSGPIWDGRSDSYNSDNDTLESSSTGTAQIHSTTLTLGFQRYSPPTGGIRIMQAGVFQRD